MGRDDERPQVMNVRVNRGLAEKAISYFRDARVATWRKLVGVVALAYTVMPVDVVPDLIPLVGWLDDLGVMSAAIWFVTRDIKRHSGQEEREVNPPPPPSRRRP